MKTIGLIGGMSWVSTEDYYRFINQEVAKRVGGSASAELIISSVNFATIEAKQEAGDWAALGQIMASEAKRLERAGADCVLICANTMHKLADDVEAAVEIPLLHIGDATAAAVKVAGLNKIALIGTRYTMEQPFLVERLKDNGLDVMIPDSAERTILHDIIYNELVLNIFTAESKAKYLEIMQTLFERGAEGVILGCTEIELLIEQKDTDIPVFPTTMIHAQAAVDFALTD